MNGLVTTLEANSSVSVYSARIHSKSRKQKPRRVTASMTDIIATEHQVVKPN